MTLLWTRLAVHDLDAAYEYIAESNPVAAERIAERIAAAAAAIVQHPRIGKPGRVSGTRELVGAGTPFIVIYRMRLNRAEILSVMHGARMWPDRF
jgi:toxin ParE1/3/4